MNLPDMDLQAARLFVEDLSPGEERDLRARIEADPGGREAIERTERAIHALRDWGDHTAGLPLPVLPQPMSRTLRRWAVAAAVLAAIGAGVFVATRGGAKEGGFHVVRGDLKPEGHGYRVRSDGADLAIQGVGSCHVKKGTMFAWPAPRRFRLDEGGGEFHIEMDGRGFDVLTPAGKIRVVGTRFTVRVAEGAESAVTVAVEEGVVRYRNGREEMSLSAGEAARGTKSGKIENEKDRYRRYAAKTLKVAQNMERVEDPSRPDEAAAAAEQEMVAVLMSDVPEFRKLLLNPEFVEDPDAQEDLGLFEVGIIGGMFEEVGLPLSRGQITALKSRVMENARHTADALRKARGPLEKEAATQRSEAALDAVLDEVLTPGQKVRLEQLEKVTGSAGFEALMGFIGVGEPLDWMEEVEAVPGATEEVAAMAVADIWARKLSPLTEDERARIVDVALDHVRRVRAIQEEAQRSYGAEFFDVLAGLARDAAAGTRAAWAYRMKDPRFGRHREEFICRLMEAGLHTQDLLVSAVPRKVATIRALPYQLHIFPDMK